MASVALQSEDHRHLLDIIDKLRSQGISRYVDLPEIIVCGDQSAGKSSVLEAISGLSFPTKDNLCTRFPTELVLRRGEVTPPKVSINPGPERSEEERERLRGFQATMDPGDPRSLGDIVEKAKTAMLTKFADAPEFSTDTLRIELSGPDQPHLTMVDLPGLFRAGNKDQSVDNARIVRKMVRGYMKRPRSIILAVVSAKSDAALQEVTELARDLDPKGDRTLGLITKPDCLDVGSEMEQSFLSLAQNKNVVFQLGWHVLKNRSFEMRNASLAERNEAEEEFFSKGIWASLDRKFCRVAALKPRLSNLLKEQILRQLPSLLRDIETGITDCQHRLQRLGTPRITETEQLQYLGQVSQRFCTLISGAIDGVYNDPFFGSSKTDEGYQKRLRAVVQNTLTDFEERVRTEGRSLNIIEPGEEAVEEPSSHGSGVSISRDYYLDEVKSMMRRNRGCELPGTFNPLIVGELFTEQCRPWREIAQALSEQIFEAVHRVIDAILDHVAVPEVVDGILQIINPAIDKLRVGCKAKVTEILDPHDCGHPITYNHYLTDQVHKLQADRRKKAFRKKFTEVLGKEAFNSDQQYIWDASDHINLLEALVGSSEADMEREAASLAVDYMQAYYKVARKIFVDDVAVLAVEHSLIKKLPLVFSPDTVFRLEKEEIHRIVAESDETSDERSRVAEKLNILEEGLRDLKRLDKHRPDITEMPDTQGDSSPDTYQQSEPDESPDHSGWGEASPPAEPVPLNRYDSNGLTLQEYKEESVAIPVYELERPASFSADSDY